jgi:anti-sigma factor RsiW
VAAAVLLLAVVRVVPVPWDHGEARLMVEPARELSAFVDSRRALDVATGDPRSLKAWFSPNLAFAPPDPPADVPGLVLTGGRLCDFFDRRVAAYMYTLDGHVLSLYIMARAGLESPADFGSVRLDDRIPAAVQRVGAFTDVLWQDQALYYLVVSDLPKDQLVALAAALAAAARTGSDASGSAQPVKTP